MSIVQQLAVPSIEDAKIDIARRANELRDSKPTDVNTSSVLQDRKKFLKESLGEKKGIDSYERVINGDELQPVTYLARGAIAARAVARIELRSGFGKLLGYGTGFLIAPNVLITNNHVLPNADVAAAAVTQFTYELNLDDAPVGPIIFRTNARRPASGDLQRRQRIVCAPLQHEPPP